MLFPRYIALVAVFYLGAARCLFAQTCANAIACENTLPGNPSSEWDIPDAGDPTIQGYATDISVNRGQTISFKINSTASAYRIDIYRLGWYGGAGARKITTINPSVTLPQSQAACLTDAATGLIDCGNWKVSASWAVPSTAVSGVYIAKPVRSDTGGTSHIVFIVRDDAGQSDILFQTSDETWQAYNKYGGTHLYGGSGPGTGGGTDGRSYKVSYNRPFILRGSGRVGGAGEFASWLFTLEYPMIRWLESNGYNLSYAAGMDTDRRGVAALTSHKTFLSVGHDEYWSGGQRTNVEAARAAGVNLAFFSGNEIFWKTRWENSIDSTHTAYRTLVCYKETHANAKIDPTSAWTGTWRDARFSPPADGGRPENALTGSIFTVNAFRSDPIVVSATEGRLRFWRNTGIDQLADGLFAELPAGVLGDEWDEQLDNGFRPGGLLQLSTTTINPVNAYLQDNGSNYAPGAATHHLSLYRHSSGALVFGAGTIRWMWGLDSYHDDNSNAPNAGADVRMQQATANILADMGALPTTLQPGLVQPSTSTDIIPPTSNFLIPSSVTVPAWSPMTLLGIATDAGGGRPAAVELSLDGGTSWHQVSGAAAWGGFFTAGSPGTMNVKSRAIDDSARIEVPGPGITVNVTTNSTRCTLWPAEAVPTNFDVVNSNPEELGVRFLSDVNGWITALRFYKSLANVGTHIGNLWSNTGTLLGTVTFTNETASGWQEARLPAPVPVTAGTKYVASFHMENGFFCEDANYFAGKGADRGPLHAPPSTGSSPNGLYALGASAFPTNTFLGGSNYWVDVVYTASLSADVTPPLVTALTPAFGSAGADPTGSVSAQFNEDMATASISGSTLTLRDPQNNTVAAVVTYDSLSRSARLQPATALSKPGYYTATIKGGGSGVSDLAGNKMVSDVIWSFSAGQCTLFPPGAAPTVTSVVNPAPEELGVRFMSESDGWITALRFYKSEANVGPHIGNLWSNTGTLLANVTFSNETASGWQQAQLATPIAITAGAKYVASYHMPNGGYAEDQNYFADSGVDRSPLHAPAGTTAEPNGVYSYGASAFPTQSYLSSNYWVDVVYTSSNQLAAPVMYPPGGTYPSALPVTLSSLVPGAQIYYTTNGSTPTASSTRYTIPFLVTANTAVRAIAIATGWTNSPVVSATYAIQASQVGTPVLNPPGSAYSGPQSVILSDATPGATIYYTTNGSTPTTSSTRYAGPITISGPTTIKAIATLSGLLTSNIATGSYTFQAAPPVANPQGGLYTSAQSVTLSDASPGASIYYTTNGSTPTTASTRYTAAIPVTATTTINAIAAVGGWSNSDATSTLYTIQLPSRPSAPSGLSATAASAGQIDLNWTDLASNENGYKIERKTGTGGTYAQIATAAANATSYSDFTASASTTYVYRLRATNSAGDSAYSNEATVTTPAPAGPPAPWVHGDIGTTGATGSATYINGTFTVKGAGADIWGTADGFRFVYQSLAGNGEIVARVASVQNTNAWAKAGVMIRETTAANSRNVLMAVTPGNGLAFQSRASAGGSSTSVSGPAVTAPYWVRLVRSGSTFTGYGSSNGTSWTQVGTATISMANTVQIGLALTSHSSGTLNTSVFDSVAVGTQLGTPTGLTATPASGSQINLSWVDNSTGETGFKIERKIGSGGTYAQITTVGAGVTTYSDPALGSGTTYFYRIRATNATGDSAYSAEASATTSVQAPPVPGGLAASAVSSTQINLSWNDVSGESGFKIERKTGPSGTYTQIATVGAGIVTYNNTGLVVNTTYYYRVRATNSGGDSGYSAEVNATTLNAAPAAPSGLVTTAASTTQINLTWVDNSTNETGFRIERNAGGSYVEITTVGAGITSFPDTGLSPGTTYLYRVRATNALGDSAYTAVASATTLAVPPSMPTGLVATAVSSTQINLTWSDVATETGFKLERKTGSGGTYAQIATVGANVTSYSNTGLSANTIYFYRIRATNSGGDSVYSAEASATTLSAAPAAPAGLAASTISSTQINLSWSDVSNETGFKIERKTGSGGTYAQIATVGANVTSYSNTSLTAGTTYFYRIRATNAVGDSAYSNEVSATTSSAVPAAPAGLVATPVSATQINLSWSDVANETNFKIERKTGSGGTYAQIATTGANVTSYSNTGLTAGTTYVYRVRAANGAGNSAYSSEVSVIASVPTFRSSATKGATSGTLSLTISKPSGTAQGDVMVASIAIRPNTATITPVSGWTLVRRTNNTAANDNALAVYYKVAGASEASSYKFTFNTSVGSAGGIASFSGVNTTSPIDVEAGQNTPSALTHSAPGVTTRYPTDLIVTSYGFSSSATFTPPSGMSEAFDVKSDSTGSSGETVAADYKVQTNAGPSGTLTATASNDADAGNAHALALRAK